MKKENLQIAVVALLVLSTALWRVANAELHIYNLVPVAALGLFSGSILKNKQWAYIIPLSAMFLSDLGLNLFTSIQGFYGISQIVNYIALGLVTFMGSRMQNRKAFTIVGYTISGSMLFFVLSNFGTFLSGFYGYSFASFTECYAMALPFYRSDLSTDFFVNSFSADLLFSAIAFGTFAVVNSKKLILKKA
jgi:hypothetical protein